MAETVRDNETVPRVSAPRVLVIDNYDSFVYNLVQYLGQLGVECEVRRNDEIDLAAVGALRPAGILLSPGPGTPDRAGICLDLIRRYADQVPIFGVCLGHQAFGEAFGATVTRAPELLHGKTSLVSHSGVGVLTGLPDPFTATGTTPSQWSSRRCHPRSRSPAVPSPAW